MKNKNGTNQEMNGRLYAPSFFLAVLLALLNMQSYGQQRPMWNKELQSTIKPSSEEGWLNFKEETNINPESIFTDYKSNFGLGADDEMRLVKTFTDNTGMVNYRYQQYYKGYKIKGAEYIVHALEGKAVSANGKMIQGISQTLFTPITEKEALNTSLGFVNSKNYTWLNDHLESRLKKREHNENATSFPKGELIWVKQKPTDEKSVSGQNLVLCWKFDINVEDGQSQRIFLDAKTGALVNSIPLEITCNQTTGTTTYNGNHTIWTSTDNGHYIMYEDCGSPEFHTYNANNMTDYSNVTEFIDYDNIWNSTSQQSVMQTQFGLRQSYWYYKNTFNRDSYDDANGDIDAYNNSLFVKDNGTIYPNNASWVGNGNFRIGPGYNASPNDDLNADDVLGHEFTHGVTEYSANLDYQDESGALNESFSDIFGEMVEKSIEGSNDWLMGADMSTGALRCIFKPDSFFQPDTYLGTYWATGTDDHGGVHKNSGVQNFAFYLLAVGGSGVNDNGKSYSVSGIGTSAAAAIAYRALTVYMNSSDQYIDARRAWIQAAIYLYGGCSNEAIQTGNAWHAVGVESQSAQYVNSVCGYVGILNNQYFQAINTLDGGNGCSNIVPSSIYSAIYSSDMQVILHPGFTAQSGSHFTAYIEPCAVTMYSLVPGSSSSVPAAATMEQKISSDLQTGSTLTVTPNPFKNNLKITATLNEGETVTVTLYDVVGKQAGETIQKTATAGKNEINVDTSKLSPGVYFITVQSENMKETKKIVKAE